MDERYLDVLGIVMQNGRVASPRGVETRELLGVTLAIASPYGAMPMSCPGRKTVPAIGVAEALQLIAGKSYPRLLTRISRNFAQFMDGEVLQGAYGPRIRAQLPLIVDLLRRDPNTRQAIVQIWDPIADLFTGGKDVACTLALHFILRDNTLELHSKMRSQDCWWGLTYDIFQFAELLGTLAHRLGVKPGSITHTVTSLHIYARDFDRVRASIDTGWGGTRFAKGIGLAESFNPNMSMRSTQDRADAMLRGFTPYDASEHEKWMITTLEPFRE
jgi:thymidylate synthase